MTRRDFFKLAIRQLLPADGPDFWSEYRAGRITHFEALRRYFAEIRASEAQVLAVVDQMELDPGLPQDVADLRRAGWKVVVTSAGCDWYIRRLLAQAGVELEVHSNPGRFVPGLGLQMEMPVGSPFLSPMLGVDKARIVRHHLEAGRTVAFAGDGFPDEEAALLVPGRLRFAHGDLADVLEQKGETFQPFDALVRYRTADSVLRVTATRIRLAGGHHPLDWHQQGVLGPAEGRSGCRTLFIIDLGRPYRRGRVAFREVSVCRLVRPPEKRRSHQALRAIRIRDYDKAVHRQRER